MSLVQKYSCKIRFAMSRLPYFPIKYWLTDEDIKPVPVLWSKIMPFFNSEKGFFNFELWGWDVRELRFLNRFISPGMVFLDIGAYHGIYSIIAGRKVSTTGKVYTFEPTPSHYRRINHHLWLNKIENVVVEQLALSDSDGTTEFHIPVNGVMTVGSLKPSLFSRGKLKAITVETTRLDTYIEKQKIEKIDIIKVDVEGAEMLFFEGAKATFKHFQPLLILEAIDVACEPWGYKASALLSKVQQDYDYVLYEFDEQGYLSPHNICETYPSVSNANFLAVPRIKVDCIKPFLTAHR
ncbi:FkbM family methyltransferase [Nostoc sp. FACHB-87]|uniref:FkbM family methyltransferase n=1 Tax=Nostocales TaxID=1161 RepID=UPI00168865BC|nr:MULTISPECIES: FkbM family methyltransferase [Nostocales]MBD2452894.1 FkbM family methyltransferase [Nostoc sp. FACHB-87]MBD2473825.1 FkbM family methyltransferase [Anabaena sp. FACHB-83]MBD2491102.1 FkbM family methyltransferase [Aulosira sp. FACHB-615]